MLIVNELPKQLNYELIQRLQKIETATIGHICDDYASEESFCVNYVNTRFAGTAVTVSIEEEDAAVLHHALDLLRPHDLLVINIAPEISRSCWGLVMHTFATSKQISGAIVNGNITDIYSIRNSGIPIAFKNITAKIFRSSVGRNGAINTPLNISGVKINPGDGIVVDECGFAAIPRIKLKEVITESLKVQEKEPSMIYSMMDKKIGVLSGSTDKINKMLQMQTEKLYIKK